MAALSSPLIREMTLADCDRVGELRVRGWQHAYRDLMPRPCLDALDPAEDAERHRARLREGSRGAVNLVAESAGAIVGWAAYGPYRDGEEPSDDAELYALYVAPGLLGHGIGRALLERCVRGCGPAGRRMFLWVLKENTRARRFYERAGFRADGTEEPFEVAGVLVPEVRYVAEPGG